MTVDTEALFQVVREKFGGRRDPAMRILELLNCEFYREPLNDDNKKNAVLHSEAFFRKFVEPKRELLELYKKYEPVAERVDTVEEVEQLIQTTTESEAREVPPVEDIVELESEEQLELKKLLARSIRLSVYLEVVIENHERA